MRTHAQRGVGREALAAAAASLSLSSFVRPALVRSLVCVATPIEAGKSVNEEVELLLLLVWRVALKSRTRCNPLGKSARLYEAKYAFEGIDRD